MKVLYFILWACAGEKIEDTQDTTSLTAPEGLFPISSYFYNEEGCDDAGGDRLSEIEDRYMFFYYGDVFGQEYISAYGCSNAEGCAAIEDAINNAEMFMVGLNYTFSEEREDGSLAGITQSTGFSSGDGMCTNTTREAMVLTFTETGMEINVEIFEGEDYAEDADGYCTTDAAAVACENASCAFLERVVLGAAE